MNNKKENSRYPYTYACDMIRGFAYGENGCKLSRAECSELLINLSKALDIDRGVFAKKLADYYLQHEEELSKEATQRFMIAKFGNW